MTVKGLGDRDIEVAVPLPLFQTFNYRIPSSETAPIDIGTRVWVPFRNRKILSTVVAFSDSHFPNSKEILGVVAGPPISEKLLRLFQWLSGYYASPLGEIIKCAIPVSAATSERELKKQKIASVVLPTQRPVRLTDEQQMILNRLEKDLEAAAFAPYLLYGITGSGKTEIYLKIIATALRNGKEAIVLVPEISLTPQLISRFEDRFPNQIAVLHSKLSKKERYQEWLKIRKKEVSIVVGARSAVFAPFENLGIIVVDEEHDSSFKQEERFRYHARDVALVRGQLERSVVILGSATPSLESYDNCKKQKLKSLTLSKRIDDRPLPAIEIIDLKKHPGRFGEEFIFSNRLLHALTETLNSHSQAILFLNRRGYAPFLLCEVCSFVMKCPNCSISLTVYIKTHKLLCHHCAFSRPVPDRCQQCQEQKMFPVGLGTEKVEEELKRYFPDAKIARLDRSSTQKGGTLLKILSDFGSGKTDILIGTQMVAKGHDFPNVTLVGVILIDISLNIPDFRAPERTFQLLTQVAGRAGRGKKEGSVIVQTYNPSHYSLQFAKDHDYEGFYTREMSFRKELNYPPFSRIVRFRSSDVRAEKAFEKLKRLRAISEKISATQKGLSVLEILGPAPAPLSRIKNKYRFHMLIKSPSHSLIKSFMDNLLKYEKELFQSPTIKIDVDPLSLL